MRYELRSRGQDIDDGLAARVYDPLWLLARQWQFGEFRHENTGSPAWVDVEHEYHLLDEWQAGHRTAWQPYDVTTTPLERLVEQHAGGPTPRLRLEGGLRLKRLLAANNNPGDLVTFRSRCPFPDGAVVDEADRHIRSRLPDGAALVTVMNRLADQTTAEDELTLLRATGPIASTASLLVTVAADWTTWWNAHAPSPIASEHDSWNPHRLEHAFGLRATSLPSVELRATEYAGGRLDWDQLDSTTAGPGGPAPSPRTTRQRAVPAPARFGGMPAPRFWEMEDARFDPGSIDAGPVDLGRLMLIGYATVYGNDWFVLPVRMPVASLSRVTKFEVRDVFGTTTELTAATVDQDGWNMFGITAADTALAPDAERPTSPWFLLPPSLPASLEGAPTDAVMLFRDEMANMAWAVETLVADNHGRPLDRFDQWAARPQPTPVTSEIPQYQVISDVPDHWFPLIPEQLPDLESIRLRLVPLTRLVNAIPTNIVPAGSLLPTLDSWLYEEEVPRTGVFLTRTWQHARWHDGSRHLWQTRRKRTGRGEGSSGLRFDHIVTEEP